MAAAEFFVVTMRNSFGQYTSLPSEMQTRVSADVKARLQKIGEIADETWSTMRKIRQTSMFGLPPSVPCVECTLGELQLDSRVKDYTEVPFVYRGEFQHLPAAQERYSTAPTAQELSSVASYDPKTNHYTIGDPSAGGAASYQPQQQQQSQPQYQQSQQQQESQPTTAAYIPTGDTNGGQDTLPPLGDMYSSSQACRDVSPRYNRFPVVNYTPAYTRTRDNGVTRSRTTVLRGNGWYGTSTEYVTRFGNAPYFQR